MDRTRRDEHLDNLLALYRDINDFLVDQNPRGPYLFEDFGLAEAVFTPIFKRFWFLDYYEGFELPVGKDYDRIRAWRDACMAHPATEQVTEEEIVKLYYDYALGAGNGALPEGRTVSSFVFEPSWQSRPMPPRDKYAGTATDSELGLVAWVTSVKVVENLGWPTESMGQAACVVILRSGSLSAASMREKASTCM